MSRRYWKRRFPNARLYGAGLPDNGQSLWDDTPEADLGHLSDQRLRRDRGITARQMERWERTGSTAMEAPTVAYPVGALVQYGDLEPESGTVLVLNDWGGSGVGGILVESKDGMWGYGSEAWNAAADGDHDDPDYCWAWNMFKQHDFPMRVVSVSEVREHARTGAPFAQPPSGWTKRR